MTSTPEQESLNSTYGSLPTVQAAYSDPAFNTPAVTTFRSILSTTAAPMPAVASESQFETAVGTAIIHLYASAATGQDGHHRHDRPGAQPGAAAARRLTPGG